MSLVPAPPSAADRLAAIESLDDIVIALDTELRVTGWNAAAERLLGRPASESIGSALMTMVSPDHRIPVRHLLERAVSGHPIARQGFPFIRRDGTEVVLSAAIAPIRGTERSSGLVLLGHDVSEHQRLHECNNILTTILALSEIAARTLPADSPARRDLEEIRDQAGKGATIARDALGVEVVPGVGPSAEANETILVVEDEAAVRNVIVRSLRSRGYEVLEANHGDEALTVAERHNAPIHLVLTDVVMPNMSGPELFHQLRSWYPRMRVMFISGYPKTAVPPQVFEGVQGAAFLAKPFSIEQLLTEVRLMLRGPGNTQPGR
jgi:PAS domain S-box-containing protein